MCVCETDGFVAQDVHWKKQLRYSMATNSNSNLLRPGAEQSGWPRYHTVERSLCIRRVHNDDDAKLLESGLFF